MRALTITVGLLFLAVLVTAGSAYAGEGKPFYEDKLYKTETSMTGNIGSVSEAAPLFEDRYESFLYEPEKRMSSQSLAGEVNRQFGIEPFWE